MSNEAKQRVLKVDPEAWCMANGLGHYCITSSYKLKGKVYSSWMNSISEAWIDADSKLPSLSEDRIATEPRKNIHKFTLGGDLPDGNPEVGDPKEIIPTNGFDLWLSRAKSYGVRFIDGGETFIDSSGSGPVVKNIAMHFDQPPVVADGPAEGIDDTPWMDYEQAGKEAYAAERVIVFKAKPTGQKFAAHPEGHYIALTRPVEPAAPVVSQVEAILDKWDKVFRDPAMNDSQPTPVVVPDETDKHWAEYLEMAKTCDVDDIASAMMVRDAACAQYVKQKRLTHDPEDKYVVEWLEALTAQPAPVVVSDEECKDCMELMKERDELEERLDKLAEAISEHFEVPIGEHSSANDPIEVAFDILNGGYKTKYDTAQPALPSDQKETFEQWWAKIEREHPGFTFGRSATAKFAWNAAKGGTN
jgi:hypothetical protein